ncbi:hypothetical protein NDU88_000526 [Pleurodeles waltl]|uniref:THD domain-containing protein n=1 Tax=Pleurodeles waltl TaxID=8319 RepID=A0AAV7KMZ4_PLEWA|nr:hypothetical protein NDU88_000526 [Pleurodeles waltl]
MSLTFSLPRYASRRYDVTNVRTVSPAVERRSVTGKDQGCALIAATLCELEENMGGEDWKCMSAVLDLAVQGGGDPQRGPAVPETDEAGDLRETGRYGRTDLDSPVPLPRAAARIGPQSGGEEAAPLRCGHPAGLIVPRSGGVHYGPGWNREGFLYRFAQEGKSRQRRTAKNRNNNRNRKNAAAHYKVKSGNGPPQAQADGHGIIKDWVEVKMNSTNPLSYNNENGEFKVTRRGLYYLYCQVHFNEGKSIYVKLDISLDGEVAFRCLEEYSTTAASIQEAEVKVCQVSGLVLLQPNSAILIKTVKDVSLKTDRYLTYFGLFQVH